MKITIEATNLELTPEYKISVENKINSLEKFSGVFEKELYYEDFFGKGKPSVEAWVELGEESKHHKKGPYFFAELQIRFPKKSLRAKTFSENIFGAINEAKEDLERQILEYKERAEKRNDQLI